MTKEYSTPGPRALHPTFASSRSLARCSTLARLMFACLFAQADDQGRLNADAADLHTSCRIRESVDDVEAALEELVDAGMIARYETSGEPLIQAMNWWHWQSGMRRAYPSRYPALPGWVDPVYGRPGHPDEPVSFEKWRAAYSGNMPHSAAPSGSGPADGGGGGLPHGAAPSGIMRPRAGALPLPEPMPDRAVAVIPPPPAERGRRDLGTSPRQRGEAPRDTGSNPRTQGTSPRRIRESQKTGPTQLGFILAEAAKAAAGGEAG